jgi:hypothetical protein
MNVGQRLTQNATASWKNIENNGTKVEILKSPEEINMGE